MMASALGIVMLTAGGDNFDHERDNDAVGNVSDDYCGGINASFKDVEGKANPVYVDFVTSESCGFVFLIGQRKLISYCGSLTVVPACEKIKQVQLNSLQFDDNHVQYFVLDSQIEGWQVIFEKNTFTLASILCYNNKTCAKWHFVYWFANKIDYVKPSWQK